MKEYKEFTLEMDGRTITADERMLVRISIALKHYSDDWSARASEMRKEAKSAWERGDFETAHEREAAAKSPSWLAERYFDDAMMIRELLGR